MNKRNFLKLLAVGTTAVCCASYSWRTGTAGDSRTDREAVAGAWLKSCGIVNQRSPVRLNLQ